METVNVTPKEVRKTLWSTVLAVGFLILLWRLPELLSVFIK